jgi:hypothetical protein
MTARMQSGVACIIDGEERVSSVALGTRGSQARGVTDMWPTFVLYGNAPASVGRSYSRPPLAHRPAVGEGERTSGGGILLHFAGLITNIHDCSPAEEKLVSFVSGLARSIRFIESHAMRRHEAP